ncbi:MAG: hypothetical protein HYR84_12970 [Planctomycetes bacterium]|nr:hypothetical protein [Planctomycetota bacterium]
MAWVEILPAFETQFRDRRWDSAASFLDWAGILVNRHRTRHVEQVALSQTQTFFIKKEFAVSWRDRFRNAWHGFGWCATLVREAATLQALRAIGIGCPEVVALGEDGRRAFLMTRDESAMTELREILPTLDIDGTRCLAEALGAELAHVHDAGFDHPDLFAKHILTAKIERGFHICILDWQRSRRRRSVTWDVRCRDLAALDATLHPALASDRVRLRFLRAYLRATTSEERASLAWLARQVRHEADQRRLERNIREAGQLPTPAHDQQFVSLHGGRLLVVRSYYDRLHGRPPAWMREGRAPAPSERHIDDSAGPVSWHAITSTIPDASIDSWEIPPLGHTLFRLQRFGVSAPRLLAVGRSERGLFLVIQDVVAIPFIDAFAKATGRLRGAMLQQAGAVIRQVHEAGYYLPAQSAWEHRLGVDAISGEVVLVNVEPLLRGDAPWQEIGPADLNHCRLRLERREQLLFLRGYLHTVGPTSPERTGRRTVRNTFTRERQAIA